MHSHSMDRWTHGHNFGQGRPALPFSASSPTRRSRPSTTARIPAGLGIRHASIEVNRCG
ncbi:hypothetical protein [Rhodocista pekingensis]|uniref:Uncharacterized protein n=1 Tax=Rhodocista pekingensis TaxID=201185 RepID=A0ABW2KYH2_9PROT